MNPPAVVRSCRNKDAWPPLPVNRPCLPASQTTNLPTTVRARSRPAFAMTIGTPYPLNGLAPRATGSESANCRPLTQPTAFASSVALSRRYSSGSPRRAFGNNSGGTSRSPNGLVPALRMDESSSCCPRTQPPRICIERRTSVRQLHRSKDAPHSPVDATPVLRVGHLGILLSAHHTARPAR